jgi:hypothetical protein
VLSQTPHTTSPTPPTKQNPTHLQLQLLDQLLRAQCSWQVILVAQHQQWDAVQAGLCKQRKQLLGSNLWGTASTGKQHEVRSLLCVQVGWMSKIKINESQAWSLCRLQQRQQLLGINLWGTASHNIY